MCRLWIQPAVRLRPARRGIELPLRPSPLAGRLTRLLVVCGALHVAELLLRGQPLAAAGTAALGAALVAASGAEHRRAAARARRLVVSAGGQMSLITARGIEPVQWRASSLRLGRRILLCLRGAHCEYWVLLGPDNTDPAALAALRRRIAGAQAVCPTPVQSE